MLGSNRASLHKHSRLLPKQFKHVDVGKTNKVITYSHYKSLQIQNQAISEQLFSSGDMLYCELSI